MIIGCNSNSARDKIIQQGEAVSLNQVIEILQTEESTHSTMQQIQDFQKRPIQQINYTAYDARSKKSKKPSNEQNSSSTGSTGSKRQCFSCGEPHSRKHLDECKAKNVTCNGCGIKGHLQRCCKKSGNFPKDNSNRQNQSSSTGPNRMNYAAALPEADFFNEKGLPKEYRPPPVQQQIGNMNVLRMVQVPNNATSVSDSVPVPIPSPDFPFQEFLLTEVVTQSQIDSFSISDMSDPRETDISMSSSSYNPDFQRENTDLAASLEEMTEIRDLTVSEKHIQSTRDSSTISI